jgi:hypothetical protein
MGWVKLKPHPNPQLRKQVPTVPRGLHTTRPLVFQAQPTQRCTRLTPQAKKHASYSVETSNQKKKKQNDERNVVELYKIFGALEGQDFDEDDTAYTKRNRKNENIEDS